MTWRGCATALDEKLGCRWPRRDKIAIGQATNDVDDARRHLAESGPSEADARGHLTDLNHHQNTRAVALADTATDRHALTDAMSQLDTALHLTRVERVLIEDLQTRARTVHRIVLDMEAVYEIDTQGADALARLARDLSQKGVAVVLARPHAPVRELLERLDVFAALGPHSVFATVEEAAPGLA